MNKTNVIHVVGYLGKGGDSTAIFNVMNYANENNKNMHFDFITHKGCNMEKVSELEKKGSKVFVLDGDVRALGIIKYFKKIKQILKENHYDAIHFHTSFQSCVGLYAAKKEKILIRICHSHTTKVQRKINILKKFFYLPICRVLINNLATKKVSCSIPAGEFLYGKKSKFNVIYNGVNIEKIKKIDVEKVNQIISTYKLKNKTIIGQVGNFNENKNQQFTLELAKKLDPNKYVFFLLGDGQTFSTIKDMINLYELKNVFLTGRVNDVNNYMAIFDFLLLPSKYGEGLPCVLVEQQIINDKCTCLASSIITKEADMGNVKYLSLADDKWLDEIKKHKQEYKKIDTIDKNSFDIHNTSIKWLNLYN